MRGSVATDQDSRLSWSEKERVSAIKFAPMDDKDVSDEETSGEPADVIYMNFLFRIFFPSNYHDAII